MIPYKTAAATQVRTILSDGMLTASSFTNQGASGFGIELLCWVWARTVGESGWLFFPREAELPANLLASCVKLQSALQLRRAEQG